MQIIFKTVSQTKIFIELKKKSLTLLSANPYNNTVSIKAFRNEKNVASSSQRTYYSSSLMFTKGGLSLFFLIPTIAKRSLTIKNKSKNCNTSNVTIVSKEHDQASYCCSNDNGENYSTHYYHVDIFISG